MSALERYSLEDLLSPSEEADWLLHPFMATRSMMMIYGRQGIGKSTLFAQLAHTFQTGEPWMGFTPSRTGPTLMLQLDMPKGDLSKFMIRAVKNGLDMSGMAIYGSPEGFNIRSKADMQALKEECERVQPVAVFCDTINDAYGRDMNGNEEVRHVLHTFERNTGDASFIYANHSRKKSLYAQTMEAKQGAAMDDADAFSGFGAFEQVPASSVELKEHNGKYTLVLQKHRLDNPGFKELDLVKNDYGFFHPKSAHAPILLQWPHSIPEQQREKIVALSTSVRAACTQIAKLTGAKPEAVRATYYRMRERGANPMAHLENDME